MFKNKGDYLRVVVYVAPGKYWMPSPAARILFSYGSHEEEAVEVLLLSYNRVTGDAARTVWSSRTGRIIGPDSADYVRSTDGGFLGYLRFPPGSLPRPARGWFKRGNKWGVERPEAERVEEGEGALCRRP